MHMTIRKYKIVPAQAEEVIRRVDDNWLDRVAKMPGFVSYHVVRPAEDQLLSVTAFLDEPAAKRGAEASAEWVGERLYDLEVEFEDMVEGPVVVHGGA
jgi:heme-degrading monooxygenase HmoA